MKKILAILCAALSTFATQAQETETLNAGSYKLLKVDVINLIGLAVQEAHFMYEISPMKRNYNNLPTVQFDLSIPFNSLNEVDVKYGLEGGVQLKFYQLGNRSRNEAEGYYIGAGIDGGYVQFNRDVNYFLDNGVGVNRTYTHEYDRWRSGIYAFVGAQTKLGDKVYFDVSLGMGWSNVSVTAKPIDIDPNFIRDDWWYWNSPFYLMFDEGKYQAFYMPMSFNIGYNFGTK